MQETIPSPIPFPRGSTFEQLPGAFTNDGVTQNPKQLLIELFQLRIDRLFRPANQVRGNPFHFTFELSW